MMLENELAVYRAHRADLLGVNDINEGKFVAIKGDVILGPFATYGVTLDVGYDRFGMEPFLVRKIERVPTVLHFSRPL